MRDDGRLRRRVRREPRSTSQLPRSAIGVTAGSASVHHRHLATHPGTHLLDRMSRSRIVRPNRLEAIEYVLRARRGPESKQAMIDIGKGPAPADRDEARVTDLREDHWRII